MFLWYPKHYQNSRKYCLTESWSHMICHQTLIFPFLFLRWLWLSGVMRLHCPHTTKIHLMLQVTSLSLSVSFFVSLSVPFSRTLVSSCHSAIIADNSSAILSAVWVGIYNLMSTKTKVLHLSVITDSMAVIAMQRNGILSIVLHDSMCMQTFTMLHSCITCTDNFLECRGLL